MDRLAYTALSATISSARQRLEMTNNLANLNTIGFKVTGNLQDTSTEVPGLGFPTRFQPAHAASEKTGAVDLSPGPYLQTGNDRDISMNDETVLGVRSAIDQTLGFTRRGDLHITPSGLIETGKGNLVMGDSGPVTVPLGQIISFGSDGSIFARNPLTPEGLQTKVGELMLRDASETRLQKRVDGLFEPAGTQVEGEDFVSGPKLPSIKTGGLEGSNVNSVAALVTMMDLSRSFEMQIKVIAEINELDEAGSALIA